jgi:hypothetical protein
LKQIALEGNISGAGGAWKGIRLESGGETFGGQPLVRQEKDKMMLKMGLSVII